MPAVTTNPTRNPSGVPCPGTDYINGLLGAVQQWVQQHPAKSGTGQLLDQLRSSVGLGGTGVTDKVGDMLLTAVLAIPTGCLTTEQLHRLGTTTQTAQDTAHAEENAFQSGILGFLSRLTSATTYIRAGELIVGVILIIVGIKQLAALYGVRIPKIPGVPFG